MKEFKGTHGPWEIMDDDGELKIVQSGSIEYGRGWKSYSDICSEVSDPDNANLIAAAPELLEALQETIHEVGYWLSTQKPELKGKIESAINKALGE